MILRSPRRASRTSEEEPAQGQSRRRLVRWTGGLAVIAAVGAVIPFAVPSATGGGAITTTDIINGPICTPAPAKAELELNTVAIKDTTAAARDFAKTVAMEKEVWNCVDTYGALLSIVDVETFIELVERAHSTGVAPIEERAEAAVCTKELGTGDAGDATQLGTGAVTCQTFPVPIAPIENPLAGCVVPRDGPLGPRDPVEMNSVTLFGAGRPFVKTIKVEKEVFLCARELDGTPSVSLVPVSIGELYIFTEIIERRQSAVISGVTKETFRPVAKRFVGLMCFKDLERPGPPKWCGFIRNLTPL